MNSKTTMIPERLRDSIRRLSWDGVVNGAQLDEVIKQIKEYDAKATIRCDKCEKLLLPEDIATCPCCHTKRCRECSYIPFRTNNECSDCCID